MVRPARFRTTADAWYVALFVHEFIDSAVNVIAQPPSWLNRLGLWICDRYEQALTRLTNARPSI